MLELKSLVVDLKPSIIMLCETFVRNDIGDALLAIEGYELVVRQDGESREGGKCRGLLVFCKAELKASEYVGKGFRDVVECAGIEIPWGRKGGGHASLKVVIVYRPPMTPFSEHDAGNTAKLCAMLRSLQGKVLVLGDLNLPGINWKRHYSASAGEKVVLDVIQNQFWV